MVACTRQVKASGIFSASKSFPKANQQLRKLHVSRESFTSLSSADCCHDSLMECHMAQRTCSALLAALSDHSGACQPSARLSSSEGRRPLPAACAAFRPAWPSVKRSMAQQTATQEVAPSSSDRPRKRSSVWVECDKCKQWRRLPRELQDEIKGDNIWCGTDSQACCNNGSFVLPAAKW